MSGTVIVEHKAVFDEIVSLDLGKCAVTVCMAAILKGEIVPRFERLQITDELSKRIRGILEKLLRQYQKDWKEEDLLFKEFADETIPPEYEIEILDLSDY